VADGVLGAYARLVGAQIRSQAQYRLSLALDIAGSAGFGAIDLVSVVVLFRVSRSLGGFPFTDVLLMVALASSGFALADLAVGNIERIANYVRTGLLDAILVRPLGALTQLLTVDFTPRRIGRALVMLALLPVAAFAAHVPWTPARVVLVVVTPLAGMLLFSAVFVASATLAFWWTDSREFASSVTYGGRDFSSYPMTIYGPVFRRLFGYGLGFAVVGYLPALALLGRRDPLGAPAVLGWVSPLVAFAAAGLAALVWRFGIRHYRSTGS
jgi:ABC-2 type transport system permease protein